MKIKRGTVTVQYDEKNETYQILRDNQMFAFNIEKETVEMLADLVRQEKCKETLTQRLKEEYKEEYPGTDWRDFSYLDTASEQYRINVDKQLKENFDKDVRLEELKGLAEQGFLPKKENNENEINNDIER